MPTAIVTGASRGLGLALARALAERGWRLVIDAREPNALQEAADELARSTDVAALHGDVADAEHLRGLVAAAGGPIDLIVNNASVLGPSPQPLLADYPLDVLEHVYRVNVLAPLALIQLALPQLPAGARILNITSDAAVEPYEGWGGYGSAKAALEQLTAILGVERDDLRVYAIDPGDMNTRMHQEAFPGEDISDRPPPEASVPGLLALIEGEHPSGRYQARALAGGAGVNFALPRALEAAAPPPVRDEVRLMVARPGRPLAHAHFLDLPRHLRPGDLLVVNASATMPAALVARRDDGTPIDLHLSTPEPPADGWPAAQMPGAEPPIGAACRWVVELRQGGGRFRGARAGECLTLPGGGAARLLAPYLSPGRLWVAELDLPGELPAYLAVHGAPIRYAHETEARSLADHQTIFASEPGSAEMPSAGRPFTDRAVRALRARGVGLARIVLHTGVSSPERGERPYPERFRVSAAAAARVNRTHAQGGRVIAVGTTVVRALESAAQDDGTVHPRGGWTGLTVTPERGVRAVDALLTGWHEPEASHLLMLEAIAGRALLERSYASALAHGYRWHEFGDVHLLFR